MTIKTSALTFSLAKPPHQNNPKRLRYHYDTWSRLSNSVLSNGITTIYQYDSYQHLIRIRHDQNTQRTQLITQLVYQYDKRGNIQRRITTNRTRQRTVERYQYDHNNNLKDYTCVGNLCPQDVHQKLITYQHYTFDTLNNIKRVDRNQTITTYDYDPTIPTRLVHYHNSNPAYPTSRVLTYDKNGNITQDDQGNNITYDPFNHVQSILNLKGKTTYLYNGHGVQVSELSCDYSTNYFIYGQHHLLNILAGPHPITFLYGTQLFAQENDTGEQDYLHDRNHNIINIVDQKPQQPVTITRYLYSPYGIESTPSRYHPYAMQHFGFDGQLTDSQTHWQFLGKGYRAYNPMLHRFMSQDALSPFNKGGINGYLFANNNPITQFDPTGAASISFGSVLQTTVGLFEVGLGIGIEMSSLAGIYPISNGLLITGGWQFFAGLNAMIKHQSLSLGESINALSTSFLAAFIGLQSELKLPRLISSMLQPALPEAISRRIGFLFAEYIAASAYNDKVYDPRNYKGLLNNPIVKDLTFQTQTEARYLSTAVLYESLAKPFTGRHLFSLLSAQEIDALGTKAESGLMTREVYHQTLKLNNYKKLLNSRFYYTGRSILRNFLNFNEALSIPYLDFSWLSSATGTILYR